MSKRRLVKGARVLHANNTSPYSGKSGVITKLTSFGDYSVRWDDGQRSIVHAADVSRVYPSNR